MIQALNKLLKTENTIILPDFGALLKIGEGFQFNKFLKYNDGKLISFVKNEFSLDENGAKEKVIVFVESITKQLSEKGSFDLGGIGVLKKNGENLSIVKAKGGSIPTATKSETVKKPILIVKTETVAKEIKEEPKKEVIDKAKEVKVEPKIVEKPILAEKKSVEPIVKSIPELTKPKPIIPEKKEIKDTKVETVKQAEEKTVPLSKPIDSEISKKKETELKEVNKKVKEEPIIEKESKRKKRFPVFLILLLSLLFLLGGAGYYFKTQVLGYYGSFKTYIAGNPNGNTGHELTPDGSKKEESHKNKEKEDIHSASVSEDEIKNAEKDYIGDSKIEGEVALVKEHKTEETPAEEVKTIEKEEVKDKQTSNVETKELTNDSKDEGTIGKLKSKIEELKLSLADSQKENVANKEVISNLKSRISKLESKLGNQSSSGGSAVANSSSNGQYKVIVGSFSNREHAERKVSDLISNGQSGSKVEGKFGGLYIVSIGAFDSKDEAKSESDKYRSAGGSSFVKKI